MSWDRRTAKQQTTTQANALKAQVVDAVGPFSPYWRDRFKALGTTAAASSTPEGLAALPAVGERDVCPDGDPAGAAALVLQAGEAGWALHAEGPQLRKALLQRLVRPGSYRAVVEADTRPTSFVMAGHGLRYPVASTRSDLDVVARAGARLWQVLGLTRDDVVVGALPLTPSAALQALQLGAVGAGSPALFPGDLPDDVAATLHLLPATVLILPSAAAATALDDLDEAGAPMSTLQTLVLLGAPSEQERVDAKDALRRVGIDPVVLAVHVPEGHRLLWAECREGGPGLHTYPDLEVLEVVDAETAEPAQGTGELVLTQLGLRGSALVRWRTGDLVDGLQTSACPACHRTVPRLVGLRRAALVPALALAKGVRAVDLRAAAGALVGRDDIVDWRIVVGPGARGGADQLLVHVVPAEGSDDTDVAMAVARDVRSSTGELPTQVILAESEDLPDGAGVSRRILVR